MSIESYGVTSQQLFREFHLRFVAWVLYKFVRNVSCCLITLSSFFLSKEKFFTKENKCKKPAAIFWNFSIFLFLLLLFVLFLFCTQSKCTLGYVCVREYIFFRASHKKKKWFLYEKTYTRAATLKFLYYFFFLWEEKKTQGERCKKSFLSSFLSLQCYYSNKKPLLLLFILFFFWFFSSLVWVTHFVWNLFYFFFPSYKKVIFGMDIVDVE